MNPTLKQELEKDLKKEYEHLREEVREKQPELLSLEEARKKKMQLF